MKLFGDRAKRITTNEMNVVYNRVKDKLSNCFTNIQLSISLKSKDSHGDIDIVVLNDKGFDVREVLKDRLNGDIIDYSKNGNIHSILYHSNELNENVHIDFLTTSTYEDFIAQYTYIMYSDFSGVLGVFSRRIRFNYGTHGFFKIYEDKRGQYHYILLTKNLKEGLQMLGYGNLEEYDKIENLDDIVDFMISSPLFDSDYYNGSGMNSSDRKRVRAGRPSADYIRGKLINSNKRRTLEDPDYFLKKQFPLYYNKLQSDILKIQTNVIPKSKYTGNWLISNFPTVKSGPLVGKILKHWFNTYNDALDAVDEEELKKVTSNYLKVITN